MLTQSQDKKKDYAPLALEVIKHALPEDFSAKIGLILGSGLGMLADEIDVVASFPYADLPGFFVSTVPGHAAKLVLGYLKGVPVICLMGRVHRYEGATEEQLLTPIHTLKRLGCETLLITNAAGSLRPEIGPGNISIVCDQINFQIINPLLGPNIEHYGPRFVSMENAYDLTLRELFARIARSHDIDLPQGIYMGVMGPVYETPAEIEAYRRLGADLVGMSTVTEVIAARHCGIKCAVISAVTNLASGLGDTEVNHDEVIVNAKVAADKIMTLLVEGVQVLHKQV